jgi:hypothetical protein
MGGASMSNETTSLQQVVDGHQKEGLLPEDLLSKSELFLGKIADVQPWYIRTMVGFGAWLASLLLVGFVGSIGFAAESGFVIVGVGLIVGAILVRRKSDNDFMVQSTLACSLAGQALLAYGVVALSNGDEFEGVLSVVAILSCVMFFVFPDRIHRVLSVLIATTSLSILLYAWRLYAIVPVLGPAFAAALIVLDGRQGALIEGGQGHLVRPLMTGMMLSAFGFLLLSTIYLLPELGVDIVMYPRPWISTILLGVLFIYLAAKVWPQLAGKGDSLSALVLYGVMALVVAAAWAVPGLLLALIVVILGASSGNRVFMGAGISFLAVFIAAYFYGIEVTMLTKALTLTGTGAAVLLARWLILKALEASAAGDASHA